MIIIAIEGWEEEEICTQVVSDGQKEGLGRGSEIEIKTHPYKTPALQASGRFVL